MSLTAELDLTITSQVTITGGMSDPSVTEELALEFGQKVMEILAGTFKVNVLEMDAELL